MNELPLDPSEWSQEFSEHLTVAYLFDLIGRTLDSLELPSSRPYSPTDMTRAKLLEIQSKFQDISTQISELLSEN